MKKTYICDTSRMSIEVRRIITSYVGIVAEVVDLFEAIGACFEVLVAGHVTTKPKSPIEYFTDMGIPTEPSKRIVEIISTELGYFVKTHISSKPECLNFHYQVMSLDEFMMVVDESAQASVKPIVKEDLMAKLRVEVQTGLSNGDWYNERIRQLVGLA